jgi:hypothetical protein
MVLDGVSPILSAAVVYDRGTLPQQRARKYLAEAIAKYGLDKPETHGKTRRPRDRFDVMKDKGLHVLKEAYLKPKPPGHEFLGPTNTAKDFPALFFGRRDDMAPELYRARDLADVRMALSTGNRPFLYWMTEELPARVPSYEEARERIKERWQMSKAREMAKKDAEKVAAELKGKDADAAQRQMKNLAERMKTSVIYLDNVSRLTSPSAIAVIPRRQQPGSNEYQRYKIAEDKVEFPSARFLEELLKLKPGEVKVLPDRPESIYYVAVLQTQATPDFYTEYARHDRALMERYEQDRHPRVKFNEGIMAQLEKAAGMKPDEDAEKEYNGRGRRGSMDE